MNFNKRAFTTIFLTTLLTCSYGWRDEAIAQTLKKSHTQQKEGLPSSNRRRGAASWAFHQNSAGYLMALMPEKKQVSTKSVDPKLLFYLLKTSDPVYEKKFKYQHLNS
ncbi:MAG: hypothetical protein AAF630_10225 [Cyanobacteria bacterium P01_C01_bin.38]